VCGVCGCVWCVCVRVRVWCVCVGACVWCACVCVCGVGVCVFLIVCDVETSPMGRSGTESCCWSQEKKSLYSSR
jgi:hypothetical protein